MAPKPGTSDPRAALRQRFAAAIPQQREEVTIDLPDGPATLEVSRISAGARWYIQQYGFTEKQSADGEARNQVVPRAFWPALIAWAYYIPGTDERMWQPTERDDHGNITKKGDEDEIASMSTEVVDALAAPALKLAGWSAEARADIRKNSAAEPAPAGSASA